MSILEVSDIRKSYGGIKALDGCSMTFEEGAINGLIGPNGSGKTTLFNVISGYETADSGHVTLRGKDITNAKRREIELEETAAELKKKTAELEELNLQKDKLFSIIAHDLRSPFNSVIGFADLLAARARELCGTSLSYRPLKGRTWALLAAAALVPQARTTLRQAYRELKRSVTGVH